MRARTLGCCLLAMTIIPSTAAGQTDDRAQQFLEQSREAMRAGEFKLARRAAINGLALAQDYRLACNLAYSEYKLSNREAAHAAYQQCLVLALKLPAANPGRDRAIKRATERGKGVADELRLTKQSFRIESDPAKCFFYVDSKASGLIETPATVWLKHGPHLVVFQASGYESTEQAVRATGGPMRKITGKLKLIAPTGTLTINSEPAGAVIIVQGRSYGLTPRPRVRLKAGSYRVRLERLQHEPWEINVDVVAGKNRRVAATLVEAVPPPKVSFWPWVTAGAGVALALGGLAANLQAIGTADEINALDNTRIDYNERFDALDKDLESQLITRWTLYGLGGAALIGGVTWGILDLMRVNAAEDEKAARTSRATWRLSPLPIRGGAGVLLQLSQ